MTLRTRIAVLLFAAVFAAAPALAIAAIGCTACCCPPPPCHQTAGDCELQPASLSCCDEGDATIPSVARPAQKAPSLHGLPPVHSIPAVDLSRARPPARGNLPVLVSPLRLSVVLRI